MVPYVLTINNDIRMLYILILILKMFSLKGLIVRVIKAFKSIIYCSYLS